MLRRLIPPLLALAAAPAACVDDAPCVAGFESARPCEPPPNRPLEVDEDALAPPAGYVAVQRTCPATPVTFDLAGAVRDPDEGDPLHVAWFVDYAERPAAPEAVDVEAFTLDPCAWPDDALVVEAVVMDRPQAGSDAEGARQTTGDGDRAVLRWLVEVEGGACCEV